MFRVLALSAAALRCGGRAEPATGLLVPPGETALLYVAVEAGSEEVVRLLLSLHDFEAATICSRFHAHAFHVATKQGHTREIFALLSWCHC
jgi:hypothetical protein